MESSKCQSVSKETVVYSMADFIISHCLSVPGTWQDRIPEFVKGVDVVKHHLCFHRFWHPVLGYCFIGPAIKRWGPFVLSSSSR